MLHAHVVTWQSNHTVSESQNHHRGSPQKACTARSLLDSFPPAARSRARRRHTDTMDPPAGTPHIPISLTATLAQPLTRRAEQICGPRHQPLVVLVPGWPPRLPPTRAPRSPDVDAKNSRGKRPHLSRARNTNIFFSAAGKKKEKRIPPPSPLNCSSHLPRREGI
jgi:hypothetical protein